MTLSSPRCATVVAGCGSERGKGCRGSFRSPIAPTSQRTINYASLRPGAYRFIVQAVNQDGHLSPAPAVVAFTIRPPVWQRGWFIALTTALIGSGFYALYRYRLARLIEMERIRTRIAADLHDDIGSSLS